MKGIWVVRDLDDDFAWFRGEPSYRDVRSVTVRDPSSQYPVNPTRNFITHTCDIQTIQAVPQLDELKRGEFLKVSFGDIYKYE